MKRTSLWRMKAGSLREGLSKRVSEHIGLGAIEKTNVATGNVMLNIVDANRHPRDAYECTQCTECSSVSRGLGEYMTASVVLEAKTGIKGLGLMILELLSKRGGSCHAA